MWLCTKLGFFSVVEKLPGEFHIRARCERDLINLRNAYPHRSGYGSRKIFHTADADYSHRIVVNREQWEKIAAVIMASIDYSNFKGVISQTSDQRDKLYTYSKFHHQMAEWQDCAGHPPRNIGDPIFR